MRIQNNQFSGILVPEIGMVKLLVKLEAGKIHFSDPIPMEIDSLMPLGALNLQKNVLEGSIPDEVGSCVSLAVANLAENNFKQLLEYC